MKKLSLFILLLSIWASFTLLSAQSRPQTNTDNKKINQRPTQTPTPPADTVSTNPKTDEKNVSVDDGEVIKVETNLVTIPVKVLDRGGKFVPGLKKEDFKIFEDEVEQDVAYFSNVEEPFTVVLMLDMSYSTVFKTSEIQSAANGFTAQLRPKDKVMVVSFDQEFHVHCEPTTDRKEVWSAIKQTKIGTGTSLYEAVDMVMKRLRTIEGRKAIVLFTDGVDTTSTASNLGMNVRDAEELDAIIYPIQYDTFNDVNNASRMPVKLPIPGGTPSSTQIPQTPGNSLPFPFPNVKVQRNPNPTQNPNPNGIPTQTTTMPGTGTSSQEYETAHSYLSQMALETGGRVLLATDKASMALAFSNIADELRQTYSLGFYPKEEQAERKRKLKVRVAQKGVAVKARESYTVKRKEKKTKSE